MYAATCRLLQTFDGSAESVIFSCTSVGAWLCYGQQCKDTFCALRPVAHFLWSMSDIKPPQLILLQRPQKLNNFQYWQVNWRWSERGSCRRLIILSSRLILIKGFFFGIIIKWFNVAKIFSAGGLKKSVTFMVTLPATKCIQDKIKKCKGGNKYSSYWLKHTNIQILPAILILIYTSTACHYSFIICLWHTVRC